MGGGALITWVRRSIMLIIITGIFHVVTTAKNVIQQAVTEVAIAQFSQVADKV